MYPKLIIDLKKIRANTRKLVDLARPVEIFGVTKAVLGSTDVAEALLAGGAAGLADSRLKNLKRLRDSFDAPLMLTRQPMVEETEAAIRIADLITVTEEKAAERISSLAKTLNKVVRIVLMIEAGDGRDGITETEFDETFLKINSLENIRIVALATNIGCSFSSRPSAGQLQKIITLKKKAREKYGVEIKTLSGGNSNCLRMVTERKLPGEIDQLRIGEAILLGHETADYTRMDGLYTDAFILEAEIIEVKEKNLASSRELRAVAALGRQDIAMEPVSPTSGRVANRSSDHLVLSLQNGETIGVGDIIRFVPSYFALLAAMTSPYVDKEIIGL